MVAFVWWRSMPRELVVPIVAATTLLFVSPFLLREENVPFILPITRVTPVLVLCALLELRRRLPAASARWIAVAIAAQVLTVAKFALLDFSGLLDIEHVVRWVTISGGWTIVSVGLAVALSVALAGAARAWRSPFAALAIVTALSHPMLFMPWMRGVLGPLGATLVSAAVVITHPVALLAIASRLGRAIQPAPDPARAMQAAARVAWFQRLSVGSTVALVTLLFVLGPDGEGSSTLFLITVIAVLVPAAGTVSGLLGLVRSDVVGLSPTALCTAAFGAAWTVYTCGIQIFAGYRIWEYEVPPGAWTILGVAGSLGFVAVGAGAARGYVARLRDRRATRAMSLRFASILALDLGFVVYLGVAIRDSTLDTPVAIAILVAVHGASALLLASMFARLARQMSIAAAVDAF